MNRLNDTKINQEQLKTLTLSKIIIEETLPLMNFLIQHRVINYNIELENFKERISTIKELIERALMDYSDKKITEIIWEETREISEKEIEEEIIEIKKIKNKNISRKYKNILKEYISELLEKLRKIQLEDIALQYNQKVYCIEEIEQVYKYI
jgi:hypothetical protein